jgi:hypothetical protein
MPDTYAFSTDKLSCTHGIFNAITGLWPILHRKSFEAVTGPKIDFWLVRTVGLLLATTGIAMALAGRRQRVTPEIKGLGIGVSGTLLAVDVIYAGKGRISRIYLLDALVEASLLVAWLRQSASTRSGA